MDDGFDVLARLQRWYLVQCDGEWEHEFGIRISTLDNPGWTIEIDLDRTPLASRTIEDKIVERSAADWCRRWREAGQYRAACGPENLAEAIEQFLDWAS